MFLEYFTPVYLRKVCSVLTSTLKNFVDCTLTGVLYTVHRAVVYNRNVSKGRYLLFFTWKRERGILIWPARLKDVFSVYTLT